MRLDHSPLIVDFSGKPQLAPDGTKMTFRDLAVMALTYEPQPGPGYQPTPAEMKARIFGLSTKFYRGGKTVDLTVDEAALIKERAGVALNAIGYGRICAWLEGEEQFVAADEPDADEPDAGEGDEGEGDEPGGPAARRANGKPRHQGRVTEPG